jgi:hypothetical protein
VSYLSGQRQRQLHQLNDQSRCHFVKTHGFPLSDHNIGCFGRVRIKLLNREFSLERLHCEKRTKQLAIARQRM